jgi:hypothetical protein
MPPMRATCPFILADLLSRIGQLFGEGQTYKLQCNFLHSPFNFMDGGLLSCCGVWPLAVHQRYGGTYYLHLQG